MEQPSFVDVEFVVKLKYLTRKEASEAESELLETLKKRFEGAGGMTAKFTAVERHGFKF